MVGSVPVGGDAPITVQTMTNTPTADARATIDQIRRCEDAGADIIRVSCPDEASTAAMREITRAARIPVVADIHFHYKRALEAADAGAAILLISEELEEILALADRIAVIAHGRLSPARPVAEWTTGSLGLAMMGADRPGEGADAARAA